MDTVRVYLRTVCAGGVGGVPHPSYHGSNNSSVVAAVRRGQKGSEVTSAVQG